MNTAAPVPFAGIAQPVIDDEWITAADYRFHEAWITDLMMHFGEWRHPNIVAPRAFSADRSKWAGKVRELAEARGFIIESGPRGYRMVGYRWLRLRTGPVPAEPALTVIEGQLRLGEAV